MKQQDLSKMKTGEVAKLARKAGIQDIGSMNKQQMIQALNGGGQQSAKAGRRGGGGHTPAPAGSKPEDWKNVPGNQS